MINKESAIASKSCIATLVLLIALSCSFGEAHPDSALEIRSQEEPFSVTFPGREARLRWDDSGALHCVYVLDGEKKARVVYRRFGKEATGPRFVSPQDFAVQSAHGEMPPTLEVLPDGTLVVAYVVSSGMRKRVTSPEGRPAGPPFNTEIYYQSSQDGGANWSDPQLLHDDGLVGGHAFLTSTRNADGEAVFSWIDGRSGHQGIVSGRTSDGITMSENQTVDPVSCQCCGTDLLTGANGDMWVAYRDATESNVRDIYIAKSTNGGKSFDDPVNLSADGWVIAGCPHTGPRLTQDVFGKLWACWFTGAGNGIYVSNSEDGGRSFSMRKEIAVPSDDVLMVRHPEIGLTGDGRLAVLYEVTGEDSQHLEARIASPTGTTWGNPFVIAENASHPRMARSNQRSVVAYTQNGPDSKTNVRLVNWRSLLDR